MMEPDDAEKKREAIIKKMEARQRELKRKKGLLFKTIHLIIVSDG